MTSVWGQRRLNDVSWHRNPNGWYYVFGLVGSGKNAVVATLSHRRNKSAIMRDYDKYKRYIGEMMAHIPVRS